jgi:hypothetical protein
MYDQTKRDSPRFGEKPPMTTKDFENGTLRLGTPLIIRGAKLLERLYRQSAMDLLTAEDPMPHTLLIGKDGCVFARRTTFTDVDRETTDEN